MHRNRTARSLSKSLSLLHGSKHLGVVTCSSERVLSANDAFLGLIGFTRKEMDLGTIDWRAITPPESLFRDEKAIGELREKGACIPFEKEYVLRDGTRVPVLLGAVRYSTEPLEWLCWVIDLRMQKLRNQAEVRSRELEERLEYELRGAELISGISARLLSKTSMPQLLDEILDAAIEITEGDFGTLQLADGDHQVIVAQRGFSPAFLRFFDRVSHETTAVCGAALRSQSRVIVEDVSEDPLFRGTPARDVLLNEGVRAVQSTPLVGTGGDVYGILTTHFRSRKRPSDRSLRFLDLVASRAGQVLESMQFSEIRRRNEGLRASGRLANTLAHEINNPIQALTNLFTLLASEPIVMEHARPLVESATEQLGRVIETAKRMLAVEFPPAPAVPNLTKLIDHMREENRLDSQASKNAG